MLWYGISGYYIARVRATNTRSEPKNLLTYLGIKVGKADEIMRYKMRCLLFDHPHLSVMAYQTFAKKSYATLMFFNEIKLI